MDIINFKKSSWHYRLANTFYDAYLEDTMSICDYSLIVAKSLLAFIVSIAFVIFLLVGFIIAPIAYVVHGFMHSFFISEKTPTLIGIGSMMLFVDIILGFILAITYLHALYRMRRPKTIKQQPTFVKLAYRSFRDKFCVPVKFE